MTIAVLMLASDCSALEAGTKPAVVVASVGTPGPKPAAGDDTTVSRRHSTVEECMWCRLIVRVVLVGTQTVPGLGVSLFASGKAAVTCRDFVRGDADCRSTGRSFVWGWLFVVRRRRS
eukprot:3245008-Rhodomonas_salina.2